MVVNKPKQFGLANGGLRDTTPETSEYELGGKYE